MSRRGESAPTISPWHRLEQYKGHDLYVDANGVFFAKDDDGRRGPEAKSVAELKRKLAGPPEALDVKGVIFPRWSYNVNEDGDKHTVIHVYGVSSVGTVLYEVNGRKEKVGRGEEVYVFDQARLHERQRLRVEARRVNAELKTLMEEWPRVERKAKTP